MTDLTKALAELRQMELSHGQLWTAREVMQTQNADNCKSIAAILNAALSGNLITRADADLAVALMVEKAAREADDRYARGEMGNPGHHIRALVPSSALAELQALQRDRDCMKANADDAYAKWVEERARAEAAEAELATIRDERDKARQLFMRACEPLSASPDIQDVVIAVEEWVNKRGGDETADQIAIMAIQAYQRAKAEEDGTGLATLRAQVERLTVKPLLFSELVDGGCMGRPHPFQYFITQNHNGRFFCHWDETWHDTLPEAQAHAQKDYQIAALTEGAAP